MTESIQTPNESDPTTERDTPRPVPVTTYENAIEPKRGFPVKPALLAVAGAAVAFIAYKKITAPVPRSEQVARKIRKYVRYLERYDFEFPELPPHLAKNIQHKANRTASAGRKLSKTLVATLAAHIPHKHS